ncbi:MAG: holin family protein [Amaricoccus sp.]
MGMIGNILGAGAVAEVGKAVGGAAEILVGNQAERDAAQSQQLLAAMQQFGLEFQQPAAGPFDRFMNGLNRLPRPVLVIATFGLFGYCMADPNGFATRMQSLDLVPDPLWWLLGAIVSFYFGARELHYQRTRSSGTLALSRETRTATTAPEAIAAPIAKPAALRPRPRPTPAPTAAPTAIAAPAGAASVEMRAADPLFNAAVEEWRRQRG